METYIYPEKRAFPRIRSGFAASTLGAPIEVLDLGDTGIGFNSRIDLSCREVALKVSFPEGFEFFSIAELLRKSPAFNSSYNYAARFSNLEESGKWLLRRLLINVRLNGLLKSLDEEQVKQVKEFFHEGVLEYLRKLEELRQTFIEPAEEQVRLLDRLTMQLLLKGFCLEEIISDRRSIRLIKEEFRRIIGAHAYSSIIMRRAYEKPLGYPGDYRLMEYIYDNKCISRDYGEVFDGYFLSTPYSIAVRMRKDRIRDKLKQYICETSEPLNILHFYCGPCRELREDGAFFADQRLNFSLLDNDQEAMEFSRRELSQDNFHFYRRKFLDIIKNPSCLAHLPLQNLIYAIGFFDYLPERIFCTTIRVLYSLLAEGGTILLTHKNREKNFPPIAPDWLCNWKFIPRNKQELFSLIYRCALPGINLSIESDEFEYTYYLTIKKSRSTVLNAGIYQPR